MNLFQVIILAVLQGLTEFLPVSSSGHLLIAQNFFGFRNVPLAFDVLLHLGSLTAILFFFKREIIGFFLTDGISHKGKGGEEKRKIVFSIFVGSLPAVFAGLFLQGKIELYFESQKILGFCFLVSALLLFSTKLVGKKPKKELTEIKLGDSLKVGFAQALAILPGISRSGATIAVGLWSGFSFITAFTFSFFLAIPAIGGAFLLELPQVVTQSGGWQLGLVGLLVAGVTSYFSLKLLKNLLAKEKLFWLGGYCLLIGLGLLFF